ncbi:hypothetical protein [Paenibacillus oleatilyticus]|uniref:Uncharacterized protein n=1 Tax=Paenibacillus oleatilyticus TaxID=2594886 RepID=A0ABV4VB99_9BACL
MVLIISSLNDALEDGHSIGDLWNRVSYQLINDIKIHYNTIQYWAVEDEDLEDCFAITPSIRVIAKAISENKMQ